MEQIYRLEDIREVARQVLDGLGERKVLALHGNLGAGKTTFVRALCDERGVHNTVSSPTFSIINEYSAGEQRVYHIDLYRLRDEQEAMQAGVEDALYSGALCLVEWPERAPSLFPENTVHLYFEAAGQMTRKIVISEN